jgi:hypothetical protein
MAANGDYRLPLLVRHLAKAHPVADTCFGDNNVQASTEALDPVCHYRFCQALGVSGWGTALYVENPDAY